MSSLAKQEQLCQLIAEQQERIRQTFPTQRGSAVVALTRARDWHSLKLQDTLHAATKMATAHNSSNKRQGDPSPFTGREELPQTFP